MALPTTNLTGHWNPRTSANLFSDDAGTVLAVDGGEVRNWHNESDASVASNMDRNLGSDVGPTYRTTSTLMKHECVDFPGTDGHKLISFNTANTSNVLCSNFWTTTAKTLAVAFYPAAITGTGSNVATDDLLIGCEDNFGLYLVDVSGTKKIRASNFDGNYDSCDLTLALNRSWIGIVTHDGSTVAMTLIDDTGTETTASVSSGTTSSLNFSLEIGDTVTVATMLPYNGRIGEFVTYNAVLSGTNLSDLKQYFKDNWLSLTTATKTLPALGVG